MGSQPVTRRNHVEDVAPALIQGAHAAMKAAGINPPDARRIKVISRSRIELDLRTPREDLARQHAEEHRPA